VKQLNLKLMRNTMFFVLFMLLLMLNSCKLISKPYTKEMKENLIVMVKEDQRIQTDPYDRTKPNASDSIKKRMHEIFVDNYRTIKGYFKTNGYPGIKENGEYTSYSFWLLVQHCDHDVNFQEKVLKQIKKQLRKSNAKPSNYAYLYDRVMKNKGKKQLYGTQMEMKRDPISKKQKSYPIEDEANVNKRRKIMGLETLEEYLKSFGY
jgi:hypothetical protein